MANFWPSIMRALIRRLLPGVAVVALATGCCAFGQVGAPAQPAKIQNAPAGVASAAKTAPTLSPSDIEAIVKGVNETLGVDLTAAITAWQSELTQFDADLRRPAGVKWSQLDRYRARLRQIRSNAVSLSARLHTQIHATNGQLRLLGPVPSAAELLSHQNALNRARLNYQLEILSAGEAAVSSAELGIDHLLNKIEDVRRKEFTSFLLRPIAGIYAYETWANVPDYIPQTAQKARDLLGDWWGDPQNRAGAERIAFEALVLFFALSFAAWRGRRGLRRWDEAGEPPFWRRASSAAGVVLLRALPVAIPVMFVYGMIAAEQTLPFSLNWLFYLTAESIVIVVTAGALVTTVFSPRAPRWRLVAVSDRVAVRLCSLGIALALVYSLATWLYATTLLVRAPVALTIAVALPSSLLMVGLLIAILRTPLENAGSAAPTAWLFRAIRSLVWALVAAIVVCALSGYLPLARFLAKQLVVTGLVLAVVYLLLLWVDGFAQSLGDDDAAVGRWFKEHGKLDRRQRDRLALPVKAALKLAVLVLAVPFIMLQWGYTWPEIKEWYRQLFFGFHIGNTQVTFGALLASLIVFAVGAAAARLFQGWLDVQVLAPAGISGGVRHSIRTGVGYVGISIAALVALSYAGFSLSSLAVVAGAFSIGIGFGLQNVVNNFVSGLILLVERPVRVGDLVVVGGEEGYVRKISVRSTEIETRDYCHVLVPNSAFISENVKNWTLRNRIGRVTVAVGAAYDCDPRKVKDVLLQVARECPDVLSKPEPLVEVSAFGGSSVDFVLNVFVDIDDIYKATRVRTDLSIAIFEAFGKAGVAIPFTQADISIRNIDQISDAVTRYAFSMVARDVERREPSGDGSAAKTSIAAD
jgi:potassium-dependent mechanosensitive channel